MPFSLISTQQQRSLALARKKSHQKLMRQLATLPARKVDERFHSAHEEAFAEIDCLSCANCCRTTSPLFREADIRRLARHLRIKEAELVAQYLHRDEDGDWVLRQAPCPFLGTDNHCSVYAERPLACRAYPHTDRKQMQGILTLTLKNAEICPAVFRILEQLVAEASA